MEPAPTTERRIVSVLFGDIVGFTPLGERLDPEDVATVQDAYFAAVREIVARYGGRVEKFIGDAAMAVFGLPAARDDDAERAVRAGLALVAAVEQLGPRLGLEDAALRLRVGINTGEVVATLAGPDEWRITGDTVNTAARLQTAAPPGGVLLGETAALTVADVAELSETGPLELKGKAEPVRAWVATGILPRRSREHAMGGLAAPMLGRESELAVLAGAVRASDGTPRRLLVVAPPGVGKSRLLDELASSDLGGAAVLRAAVRPESASPFASIAALARAALLAAGWDPDVPSAEPEAGAITPLLARGGASQARAGVLAGELVALVGERADAEGARPQEPAAGDPRERTRRFDDWIAALDLLAGPRSVAWLLEDLHWAGPDLLAFIDRVHATPAPQGRVVIGTARPSLLERAPAWCGPREAEGITRLDLEPLPPAQADALVRALVGAAVPAPLVERIARRSDGNPLFIEELLRTWVSVGLLTAEADGTWRLEDEAASIELPATVQAIYAAQIDDLPPAARRLARHASVAGRAFPGNALEALEAGDSDAVDRLRVRALIEGPVEAELGPSYFYRHVLLRDAGYATLARGERARLHARLAAWMTEAAGNRVARVAEGIARHYLAALDALPALAAPGATAVDRGELAELTTAWLERAATAAVAAGAPAAARELVDEALRLTDGAALGDRARRLALRGEATAFSGDMDEGQAAYHEAAMLEAALIRSALDAEERDAARDRYAAAVHAEGTILVEQLQFLPAVTLAEEGLALIGPGDDLATARLRHLAGWARLAYQPGPDAAADLEAALAGAERAGDARLRLEATTLLQNLRADIGAVTPDEARAQAEEVAELALETGNVRRAAAALRGRGLFMLEQDPAAGLPWLDRAAALAEAHGLREETAWVEYGRTEIGLVTGDWNAAVDHGLRALEIAEANAYHRPAVRTWFALTPVALARGRRDMLEHAKAWFDARRATFPDSPYGRFMHTAVDLRFVAAGLLEPFDPPPDLFDMWDESPGPGSWQAAEATIVGAWIDLGRTELAHRALERIHAWDDHPFAGPVHRGVADLLDARLHLADGDPAGVLPLVERALAAFDEVPAAWAWLEALRLRAGLLAAIGAPLSERAAAADALAGARDALGIPPDHSAGPVTSAAAG